MTLLQHFRSLITVVSTAWANKVDIRRVDTLADLRGIPVDYIADGDQSTINCTTTPGDGGAGNFRWDASSADADDGFATILPTGYAGTGRWKRIYVGDKRTDTGAVAFTLHEYHENRPLNVKTDFGAVGDGVVDDTAEIQAAIDAAEAKTASTFDFITVDLQGGTYGVSSAVDASVADQVIFKNGTIKAIGSSWLTTDPIFKIAHASNTVNFPRLHDIKFDCNHKCSGVLLKNTFNAHMVDCHVVRAKTYHVKAETTNTELKITRTKVHQFDWGESGFDAIANRTAYGFWIDCADVILESCVANYCLVPLYGTGSLCLVIGSHFYNGATVDGTNNLVVHLNNTDNWKFSGCYFDNGVIKITSSFNHQIDGHFHKTVNGNNSYYINLEATAASESANGLYVRGICSGLASSAIVNLSTSGGGSWASTLWGSDIHVLDVNGGRYALGKRAFNAGDVTNPGLNVSGDGDTGIYSPSTNSIAITAGGTMSVKFTSAGLSAGVANTSDLGDSTDNFYTAWLNRAYIKDGVSAPGAPISGYAVLYVDTADGDLKVMFSDGTIKTIVVDT